MGSDCAVLFKDAHITKAGKLKIAPILPNCHSRKPLICFEGHKETAM